MKLLRVKQVSEITGISPDMLRKMHARGELIPTRISQGGTRYYSEELINHFIGNPMEQKRIVIGYCRVSSRKQGEDLKRQVDRMTQYLIVRGYQFEIISDIGSGINYNKNGLVELIKRINNNEVEKIVVMYKDRLIRFGYELIEQICKLHDTEIEIINNSEITEQEELTQDLVQIITVFACRLQGKRAKKTREMIKELISNDNN